MAVRLIYTPQYDIAFFGVERFHPFDSHKYSRAWRAIRRETGRKLRHRHEKPTGPIARDELLSLHAAAYLDRDLRDPSYLSRALEIPQLAKVPAWLTDWLVLRPMRWACAGTLLAARSALNGSSAVNLSGGYHHASQARGEGFSLYSDIGLAVTLLRRSGELAGDDRVLYIDLDAHQGNGVARVFNTDPRVFIFDMYNRSIYPRDREAQRRVDCNLPISSGCLERDYFQTLRTELPIFISGQCLIPSGTFKFEVNTILTCAAGDIVFCFADVEHITNTAWTETWPQEAGGVAAAGGHRAQVSSDSQAVSSSASFGVSASQPRAVL
jgi:histone deacetylase 11